MPKVSSVKTDDEQHIDNENLEILDEILPPLDAEEEVQKYPKFYMVLILTGLFVLLSHSIVSNAILNLTPSFAEKPYLVTIVQAGIFAGVTFILMKSNKFA